MTVRELRELLDLCDDGLDVRFDVDTVIEWYDPALSEDPTINRGQYVEDGFTEVTFPARGEQENADNAYLLLKN